MSSNKAGFHENKPAVVAQKSMTLLGEILFSSSFKIFMTLTPPVNRSSRNLKTQFKKEDGTCLVTHHLPYSSFCQLMYPSVYLSNDLINGVFA